MRKLLFIGLIFCSGLAHAERRIMVQASSQAAAIPQLKEWVSESIHYSSSTCSGTGSTSLAISTSPALFYAIQITSAGAASPILTVYDSPAIQTYGNTGAGRLISGPIDGSKVGQYTFNVATSSGLWLNSTGGTGFIPPCVNVIYSER